MRLPLWSIFNRGNAVSKDKAFNDLIVLDKEAFDPDAVFLDDIVDDKVLPRLSLAVDGLTGSLERKKSAMELRPEDVVNDTAKADTTMPIAANNPELLEVYGWESSLWRKIKGYLGF
jgi:hypothetical protein